MAKIKLPEFLEDSPQTWWMTCESVFETQKVVKPIERYHHLISSLPSSVTRKILDVLSFQPEAEEERLALLKSRLFDLYSPTDLEAWKSFTALPSLQPGQKPSAMFASLRSSLPPSLTDIEDAWFLKMGTFLKVFLDYFKAVINWFPSLE